MASRSATLTVQVLVDSAKAATGVDQAAGKFSKLQGAVSKLTPYAVAAGGALVLAGKQVYDSASRQEQAMGALESVFGKNSETVKGWARNAVQSTGLSTSAYGELAAKMGASLQGMGLNVDDAAGKTKDMISLGGDLAATFGGSTQDAVDALSAALRGETDPLENYGIKLSAAGIKAEMAKKGLDKLTGDAATRAQAMTIMQMATDKAGGALGAYGRENGTAAQQQQEMQASIENMKAALGTGLLPIVAGVTTALGGMATWIGENTTLFTVIAGVIATFAGGVLALNAAFKVYKATQAAVSAATKAWTVVQAAFNIVMNSNPISLIIIAVLALVAAIVVAWNKSAAFRDFVKGVGAAIAGFFTAAWNVIKKTAAAVVGWLTARWKQFQAFWKVLVAAVKAVWNKVWTAIRTFVAKVVTGIVSRIQAFKAKVTAIVNAVKAVWSRVWQAIRQVVAKVVSAVVSRVQAFKAKVTGVVNGVKSVWSNVFNAMKSVAKTVLNAVLTPVRAIKGAFDAIVGAVKSVIDWIGRIKWPKPPAWMSSVGSAIGGIFSRSVPAPSIAAPSARTMRALAAAPSPVAAYAAPAVPRSLLRAVASGSGSGDTVNVTVNGAVDADRSARQIEQLLRQRSRRRAGVTISAA